MLDAQRTLYSTKQNLIGMRLAHQTNLVTLYKALGGDWSQTNQEIIARIGRALAVQKL